MEVCRCWSLNQALLECWSGLTKMTLWTSLIIAWLAPLWQSVRTVLSRFGMQRPWS